MKGRDRYASWVLDQFSVLDKTILERKRINGRITGTGVEIVSQLKGEFVSLLVKTRSFDKNAR